MEKNGNENLMRLKCAQLSCKCHNAPKTPKKSHTHSYEQVHQLKCLSSKKHSHIPLF